MYCHLRIRCVQLRHPLYSPVLYVLPRHRSFYQQKTLRKQFIVDQYEGKLYNGTGADHPS